MRGALWAVLLYTYACLYILAILEGQNIRLFWVNSDLLPTRYQQNLLRTSPSHVVTERAISNLFISKFSRLTDRPWYIDQVNSSQQDWLTALRKNILSDICTENDPRHSPNTLHRQNWKTYGLREQGKNSKYNINICKPSGNMSIQR